MALQNEVVFLLKEAKATLSSPRKWRKGGDTTGGRVCLMNAVPSGYDDGATKMVEELICRAVGRRYNNNFPTMFNDDPKTTYKDVIAVLDEAIIIAELE